MLFLIQENLQAMRKSIYLALFLLTMSSPFVAFVQNVSNISYINNRQYIDGLPVFTEEDLAMFKDLPEVEMSERLKGRNLPVFVDNSQQPYMRSIFNQSGLECGQAAGVAYLYTYEVNRLRNLPSNVNDNLYPTHFVFNWSNSGSGSAAAFFDSWNIIKELGTPNVTQYGGSLNSGGAYRWMNGYDLYYQSMSNRLWDFYKIPLNNADELEVLKHWIDNHTKGEETGGLAVFYASYSGVYETLPPGTPEAGKYVLTTLHTYANHALTIVGYHDSIRYDLNGDGKYTNHLDINNDGVVDILDWEIGGVKIANSYSATSWGNQGYAYLLYNALCRPLHMGGVWNRSVYVANAKEHSEPQITYKATITHNSRECVKVMAGVAKGYDAQQPEHIIEYPVLNYQGGDKYMQGGSSTADKTLEFGLDVTALLNHLESGEEATFFFLMNEKDPYNNATGVINSFSLIDYTNTMLEIPCQQTNIPIVENGLTMLKVNAAITFEAPEIIIQSLDPATVNEPYEFQMLGGGGKEPYQWKIRQQYSIENGEESFPYISSGQLNPNNSTSGFATKVIDFDFPFYDKSYNKIYIHTDGYLMFTDEPYPWIFLVDEFVFFKNLKNISPYMAKVLGVSQGGGMWYEGDQDMATFRWKATEYSTGNVLNFAVSLFPSGSIEFFYGEITAAQYNKWHAGISNGDDLNYHLLDISNTYNVQPNTKIVLEPDYSMSDMKITEDGLFYGTPTQSYEDVDISFSLMDSNGMQCLKTLPFSTDGINKIVIRSTEISAGDDNIIEYGETVFVSVKLQNISDEVVNASLMTISGQDQYVGLIDNTQNLNAFEPGEIVFIEDAFSFEVSPYIPNNHNIIFNTQIDALDESYNSHIYLKAYTPVLAVGNVAVDDGNNGLPEPGETIQLLVNIVNSGGGKAYNLNGAILINDPFITIEQGNWSIDLLEGNQVVTAQFEVAIDQNTPIGHVAYLIINVGADQGFSAVDVFAMTIGFVVEDFETGNFSSFDWEFAGNSPWVITNQSPWEGQYCMKSGNISHSQSSTAKVTMEVMVDGEISFYYKVSSETNYDFLSFAIDGSMKGSWSGNIGWTNATYPVQAGERTFSWHYDKDYSVSNGSDCGWIDYIIFPPSVSDVLVAFAGPDMTICENNIPMMQANVANAIYVEWCTTGDGVFNNPEIVNPYYTPGINDIESGSVQLTITAYDDLGSYFVDDMTLFITRLPFVFAGEDLTVCNPSEVELSGSLQFTFVCLWSTSGDGVFTVNNQPVTTYYPGDGDLASGTVELTLKGFSMVPCAESITHTMNVLLTDLPEVEFSQLPEFCIYSPDYQLTEGSPPGGVYSGPGVIDGWFYPSLAGIGLHVLTYTFIDEFGCENFAEQTAFVDECFGLNSGVNVGIDIFPNPTNGSFKIVFDQNIGGNFRIEIFNIKGQRLFNEDINLRREVSDYFLDIGDKPEGIYLLKITCDTMFYTSKLILKK